MADTYLKLHDGFPENGKIVRAGGDAGWLHICALAYASRNLTDGIVPAGVVPRLSDRKQPAKLAAALVKERLWHGPGHDCPRCPQPGEDEYVIHDYLEHQRSAEKVEEIRAKRAESGRRGGSTKAANGRAVASAEAKQSPSKLLDGCHDGGEAKQTPVSEEVLRTSHTETDIRPTAGAVALALVADPEPDPEPATADELVADWLDHIPKRPPGQVIGHTAKLIKQMLDEKIAPRDIRAGIAVWTRRGLHPSVLPSVVNEVMNAPAGGQRRPSTGHGDSGPYLPEQDYSKVTL